MAFVQLIVFGTSEIDKVKDLADRYREQTEGKRTVRRVTMCADRDAPNRYTTIAEFDSAEDAGTNSNLPETQAFAEAMGKLADGPVAYHNLEVIATFED
jgi:quinol monooxygenase YgiN